MTLKQQINLMALIVAVAVLAGCVSKPAIDWETRIGESTYDDVVRELGPPEKETTLSDGSRVGDWLVGRGPVSTSFHTFPDGRTTHGISHQFPDRLIRLTFGQDGRLSAWKRVYR